MRSGTVSYIIVLLLLLTSISMPPRIANAIDRESEDIKVLQSMAEQGNARAQYNIAIMYAEGKKVGRNDTEAVKWYRKAADQEYTIAQNNLGVMYAKGDGVERNYAEAVKWYRKAADQGYAVAQNNLGGMYANGEGVVKDDTEAVKWFRKAAEQGDDWGQYKLGTMYFQGRGLVKNDTEAAVWYRKSAEQGFDMAQVRIGYMYAKGIGFEQNKTEAINWYSKAAKQGNKEAQSYLRDVGNDEANKTTSNAFKTTADQLFAAYEDNEVAADERMKGGLIEVTGTVQSIDKNFLDSIIVRLATRNHFLSVNLTVGDSEKQRAMQSKKGERVTLVCEEMHRIIFPTGTGCRFK